MLKRVFTKPQNVCNRALRFKTNLKEDCGFEKNGTGWRRIEWNGESWNRNQ